MAYTSKFSRKTHSICLWGDKPAPATVRPYLDTFMFTDIGNGGSEGSSDGTRYSVVGGQAITFTSSIMTAQNATAANTKLLSFALPAGLMQQNDLLEVILDIKKSAAVVNLTTEWYFGLSDTPTSTSNNRNTINGSTLQSQRTRALYSIKDTATVTTPIGYTWDFPGQSSSLGLATSAANFINQPLYVGVDYSLASSTESIIVPIFVVTLKTCG